MQWEILC